MSSPTDHEMSGETKKWQKRKRTQRNINSISPPVISSSTSSSADFSAITTEEEDIHMANLLLHLSRGMNEKDQAKATRSNSPTSLPLPMRIENTESIDKSTNHRIAEPAAHPSTNDYTCKTCNKNFSSFQALGGHRASHKKPKLAIDDQKIQSPSDTSATSSTVLKIDDISVCKEESQINSVVEIPHPVLVNGTGKVRVHKCQICQAEFSTGQALGGHMRRHKPLNGNGTDQSKTKNKSLNGNGVDQSKNKPLNGIGMDESKNMQLSDNEMDQSRNSSLVLDLNLPPSDQEEMTQPTPPVFILDEIAPTQLLLGRMVLNKYL